MRGFGYAPFLLLTGGYMDKNIKNKNIKNMIIDITAVELMPGEPTACLGNGEQGFECCCDECDYYLLCFPEIDSESKEENIAMNIEDCIKQKTPLAYLR